MPLPSRFIPGLLLRLALLLLAVFAFVQSLYMEGLGAARLVAALFVVTSAALLWRHVQRTNIELARFIEVVRFGDLSQGFIHRFEGSGFGELGRVMNEGISRLREEQHRLVDANRFYEAVLDDAPTALLIVDADGRVELANKAARRLLMRHQGIRADDFRKYGDAFTDILTGDVVGRPRLMPLVTEGMPQTVLVSAAVVHRLGGLVRVVAVQPIQGELNAVEIAAQSDLIRVLTHEIMNSMTPVTSLAHSAVQIMRQADSRGDTAIAEARVAVETLARRADGVMHFVESYRQISRAPQVRRRHFEVLPWVMELGALFRAGGAAPAVDFSFSVEPEALMLDADPDLMSQVVINLLRNAAQAACGHAKHPEVTLSFIRDTSGRTRIEVVDNGPGVPEPLRQDVFLPFFTTKAKGTGVGLSFARQVVLAHHGSIRVGVSHSGGAMFRIVI